MSFVCPLKINMGVRIFLLANPVTARVAQLVSIVDARAWMVFFPCFSIVWLEWHKLEIDIWSMLITSSWSMVDIMLRMILMMFLACYSVSLKSSWTMRATVQWVSLNFSMKHWRHAFWTLRDLFQKDVDLLHATPWAAVLLTCRPCLQN